MLFPKGKIRRISTNQPFPGTDEFRYAFIKKLIFNFFPDDIRYGKSVWASFFGALGMRKEAKGHQPTGWAKVRTQLSQTGPIAAVGHRIATTVDPNLARYNLREFVPRGSVINPRILETIYVWAHKQVNDLNRPGGFFDWTWNSRYPGTPRPHLDYPQQNRVPRMAAAAAIPIGISVGYAAREAMSNGIADIPWALADFALPHSIRKEIPPELRMLGAGLCLALFRGGSVMGGYKLMATMMGPMMAAGMGLNMIGQSKGIQTLEMEQLGNNLLLSFIGTGAATLLTQLPVVGTLMTIGGVVFVSDMALGAAMTGAVGLATLGDVQGANMDTYRLGRKAWDLVLKERDQGMSFLSNLSYLSYRSNFLGNAAQLEKDAAQKETQLKNDVQEFLDTTLKQALVDATDKKTGKTDREKFSQSVAKALWQIRQGDKLNTDLVYLICDVEKENPLNQLFTQAFIPQANWGQGVRRVQTTSPENVDLLITHLMDAKDGPSHPEKWDFPIKPLIT